MDPIEDNNDGDSIEEVYSDTDEDTDAAASTSSSLSLNGSKTIFVVQKVVKALGGYRPSILFDGYLAELQNLDGTGHTLRPMSKQELQLSFRYEPPSPKFTRQRPLCASYRLQLLQGSQFLYLVRGLPKTLILDAPALAIKWGQVQAVFQSSSDLQQFLEALRYIEVQSGLIWEPDVASAWLKLTESSEDEVEPQNSKQTTATAAEVEAGDVTPAKPLPLGLPAPVLLTVAVASSALLVGLLIAWGRRSAS